MQANSTVQIGPIAVANDAPFVLFGGLNVLESKQLASEVAERFQRTCAELEIPYVFKASFDKANRSSKDSFRGPGLDQGLAWLAELKQRYGVRILTDVHEPGQAKEVAEVADVLQLPAFLARQTDLVRAIAETGAVVNIKKPQFLAPEEMRHIVDKFLSYGNPNLLLCERGTCFGYHNLVVDMLGFGIMKAIGTPVIFDVTHALQQPGALSGRAGGRRAQVRELALSAMAQGLAGLFVEAHPEPDEAKCDGPSALTLSLLPEFLAQVQKMDRVAKELAGRG